MKTLFAVTRRRGPAWQPGDMTQQRGWRAHAECRNAHAARGTVVLGGPLDEGGEILLILAVRDEAEVHAALAPDPWIEAGLLETTAVRRWTIALEASAAHTRVPST